MAAFENFPIPRLAPAILELGNFSRNDHYERKFNTLSKAGQTTVESMERQLCAERLTLEDGQPIQIWHKNCLRFSTSLGTIFYHYCNPLKEFRLLNFEIEPPFNDPSARLFPQKYTLIRFVPRQLVAAFAAPIRIAAQLAFSNCILASRRIVSSGSFVSEFFRMLVSRKTRRLNYFGVESNFRHFDCYSEIVSASLSLSEEDHFRARRHYQWLDVQSADSDCDFVSEPYARAAAAGELISRLGSLAALSFGNSRVRTSRDAPWVPSLDWSGKLGVVYRDISHSIKLIAMIEDHEIFDSRRVLLSALFDAEIAKTDDILVGFVKHEIALHLALAAFQRFERHGHLIGCGREADSPNSGKVSHARRLASLSYFVAQTSDLGCSAKTEASAASLREMAATASGQHTSAVAMYVDTVLRFGEVSELLAGRVCSSTQRPAGSVEPVSGTWESLQGLVDNILGEPERANGGIRTP